MRPVAPTPLPERIGPWRIGELLGQGGMATVYRATDPTDGREVAIKWLRVADDRMAARLRQEQRCMEAIRHPGVAQVYGIGEWEGRLYVVMERINGTDLRVYAERLRRLPAAERHARVREIAASLCETLEVIHAQGMIHRDVKPANVLVEAGGRVVLTDFGVACAEGDGPAGTLIGTAAYAAPEQLLGQQIDARADQYGLGATLYWLLCGRKTAEKKLPSESDPTIPPDLEAFVLRLLSPDPDQRFRSVAEARQALGGPLAGEVPLAGRQAVVDQLALALGRVAAGEVVRLRLEGPVGSGKQWTAGLARMAASRRGLFCYVSSTPVFPALPPGSRALLVGIGDFPGAEPLALPPLPLAELRRSVYAAAPATPAPAEVAERLHRETGGNPGLLVQLLRRFARDGQIRLPPSPEAGGAPLEIDATRWIGGMDLDAQEVAGGLAVATVPLSAGDLSALAQVPAESILPELERRSIALRIEGSYSATGPRHTQNETSPATLYEPRWALAAEVLRAPLRALLADAEGVAARLQSLQARRRGLPPVDPLLAEADALLDADRPEEARLLVEARLTEGAGAGAGEGAGADDRSGDRGDLSAGRLLWLGELDRRQGDSARAWDRHARALGLARHPLLRSRAQRGIAEAALQVGHGEAALSRFELARSEAIAAGDEPQEILALLGLAEARCLLGGLAEAQALSRRAVQRAAPLPDRALHCRALRQQGLVLLEIGLSAEAGQILADASALAKALHLPGERVAAHILRACATLEERPGDRTAAITALDRLAPLLTAPLRHAPAHPRQQRQAVRAWAAAVRGDRRTAERALQEALSPPIRQVALRLRVERILIEAQRALGETAEAARAAERVHREARLLGFRLPAWQAARMLARLQDGPLPPPGELAQGLDERGQQALQRR